MNTFINNLQDKKIQNARIPHHSNDSQQSCMLNLLLEPQRKETEECSQEYRSPAIQIIEKGHSLDQKQSQAGDVNFMGTFGNLSRQCRENQQE